MMEKTKQTALKFKKIEMRSPKWDSHPEKSTTNNSTWRQGLFIIFEDYDGKLYDYLWVHLKHLLPLIKTSYPNPSFSFLSDM